MNPKTLAILAAVTVLVVAAAFFALGGKSGAPPRTADEKELFPELSAKINDAVEMSITKAEQTATLVREGDAWVCRESGGYRADFEKVRSTLVTLARMEIVETMTKDPERHAKLGVDDAAGARVALRDASGATLADVVVGDTKYARSGQQVYARAAGRDQVYRCKADLALSADPLTWVDREVLKLDGSRPSRIEIEHADGERVAVSRMAPSTPNWQVADVPGDRRLKTDGIANGMGTALSYLSFDEVKKADELPLGTNHAATARTATFDGLDIEVRVARIDAQNWITVDAAYEAPPAPVGPVAPEEDGEAEESDNAADHAKLAAEAAALHERLAGWAYRIPQYKADLFLRRMSDLLAPEDGADAGGAGTAGDAGAGLSLEDLDPELRAAIEAMQNGQTPPTSPPGPPPASPVEEPSGDTPASDAPPSGDGGR